MTGYEMNQATSTYNYSAYGVYAVIFWAKGEASVIKISNYMSCGSEADQNCITSTGTALKGNDQQGRQWSICTANYCY